jgi:glycogen debranching enzyme
MQSLLIYCLTGLMAGYAGVGENYIQPESTLAVAFHSGYGSIEVGGPYVGFESHHSRPLPSRLSFFAPVANSMDLSTDYWRRDESQIFFLGLQIDDGPRQLIGWEPWPYLLSPAAVQFSKQIDQTQFTISYSFFQTSPGMMARIVGINRDSHPHTYRLYTHWETSLRTCQSYKLKDRAHTSFDPNTRTVFADFDDPETAHATVLVGNGATPPRRWSANSAALWHDGQLNWMTGSDTNSWREPSTNDGAHRPAAAFLYEKNLAPGDSLVIVHFLASTKKSEAVALAKHLAANCRGEAAAYEKYVSTAARSGPVFHTGNPDLDHSTQWAKALLAANRHFLDGEIVPMPCPAEYNFYFTHDALMTDLAAANFDANRVRTDLLYLANKVNAENIIPHAYYWKDDGFKTEFAGQDNWNHFWFILVAASYLRHTGDLALLQRLQPVLEKSLTFTLSHLGEDGLLWAGYPDWWDIGKVPGPRAYMTALAIRALQEFVFIGNKLQYAPEKLQNYLAQAQSLRTTLAQKLWDEQLGYLINFNNGTTKDEHIYAGPLLAVVFDEIATAQQRRLVATARQRLYDPQLGVRTVDPADFHLLEKEFQLVNHEQGKNKGEYINGGVWPHGTAWYALALQQVGDNDAALEVVLNNMTIAGIARSPHGQPAMYEYRYSDPATADYGRIDKPSFLWAGGWYLFTLYRLLGAAESPWNLHLRTNLPSQTPAPEFEWLINGKTAKVVYSGQGQYATSITYDGVPLPSLVIPEQHTPGKIQITRGTIAKPYLENLTATLIDAQWRDQQKSLRWQSRAFTGHYVSAIILSAQAPKRILVDQKILPASSWPVQHEEMNSYRTVINYSHASPDCEVQVEFENQ